MTTPPDSAFLDKAREITSDGWHTEEDPGLLHIDVDDLRAAIALALEEAVKAEREAKAKITQKWIMAQKAINQIDDGFEYRLGDDKARKFVAEVLAGYTAAIQSRGQ